MTSRHHDHDDGDCGARGDQSDYADYPDYAAYAAYARRTSYDDDDDDDGQGQASASGVRLLTSVDDPSLEPRLYVAPGSPRSNKDGASPTHGRRISSSRSDAGTGADVDAVDKASASAAPAAPTVSLALATTATANVCGDLIPSPLSLAKKGKIEEGTKQCLQSISPRPDWPWARNGAKSHSPFAQNRALLAPVATAAPAPSSAEHRGTATCPEGVGYHEQPRPLELRQPVHRAAARSSTVKLQRKKDWPASPPRQILPPAQPAATSTILASLPHIPDGPSPRRNKSERCHDRQAGGSRAIAAATPAPMSAPAAPFPAPLLFPALSRKPVHPAQGHDPHILPKSDPPPAVAPLSTLVGLPSDHSASNQHRAAYNPSLSSIDSRRSSIRNPPSILPSDSASYVSYNHHRHHSSHPRACPGSPTRPWTPSAISDLPRPPPSTIYEPADLNGSPRPGSPKRPLPLPRQRFANDGFPSASAGHDPRTYRHEDDMFGTETDLSDHRGFGRGASAYGGEDDGGHYEGYYGHDYHEAYDDGYGDDHDHHRGLHRNPFDSAPSPTSEGTGEELLYGAEKVGQYGPAPMGKQERRGIRELQMSKKEVQLINGELVLECKIPTILNSFLPRRGDTEFSHMRYTAVTCDPDDFVPRGYKLRQNMGRTARETELFICITMYNEDELNFTRTMHAVMKNISHFCTRSRSRTWGENGWQKIVVCIVSDGREKIHPRTLDGLAAMGVYQHGIAKNFVNSKAVQAHVYEYTTQVSLDSDLRFKGAEKGIVPCQIIFCLKEKNQRKLNSHRWFFNAFGRALNPNVCILLDVGTRPGNTSLYYLWKAFDTDSNVAGACGEIKAMKGRLGSNLLNPLVASQNFEYKLSNILDKPLESVFGYITVLPGALSAYRYHALQNDETGHGPLSQYFKGETLHGQNADVFTANMYLAEDRILCWELVAKRGERWVLKYVKGCTGDTDVPDTVPEFISQRRRWLNGAFFAAVYSLVHFRQIWKTDHTFARKMLLHIEFIYQFVQVTFTYFSLANFYLTFFFIAGGLADERNDPFGHNIGRYIFTVLRYLCILLTATQFILSLGNRPQGAAKLYLTSMVLYSIIMAYTTFACIYIVVRQLTGAADGGKKPEMTFGNNVFTNLIVSTASTLGIYFLMSFLYLDPWHMFSSLVQYFLLLPSYICTLQVYAFCNTHDVTWGTKGDNVSKTDLGGAVGKGGSDSVELEMPSEQLDIDSGYDEALRNLRDRVQVPTPPPSEAQMQEDYYKSVRSYMVVLWMIANAILAMAVSEVYGSSSIGDNFYLRFILWSVASLALFRALGSTTYAVINLVNMIVEGRVKMSIKLPNWSGDIRSRVSDKLSSISSSMR